MSNVDIWWLGISIVSVINIVLWLFSVRYFIRTHSKKEISFSNLRYWQIWLSGVYVFVCAYRSFFPRVDVQRYVLYDSWFSNILLGRSCATIAELCFAIQWAIIIYQFTKRSEDPFSRRMPFYVVGLILIAEICSWYAVITTNFLGHVFEESIWGLCTLLIIYSLKHLWPIFIREYPKILTASLIGGLLYFAYLALIDVPMYYSRWITDQANHVQYLSFWEGIRDLNHRWIVDHKWSDWKIETVWMSLYFSFGVWFSIALINAPGFKVLEKQINGETVLYSEKEEHL